MYILLLTIREWQKMVCKRNIQGISNVRSHCVNDVHMEFGNGKFWPYSVVHIA
jgi:hypothetical protein